MTTVRRYKSSSGATQGVVVSRESNKQWSCRNRQLYYWIALLTGVATAGQWFVVVSNPTVRVQYKDTEQLEQYNDLPKRSDNNHASSDSKSTLVLYYTNHSIYFLDKKKKNENHTSFPSTINATTHSSLSTASTTTASNPNHDWFRATGIRFEPGSLPYPRKDVLRQCFIGTKEHPYFLPALKAGCAYSSDYNFTLRYVEKTGTVTQQYVLQHTFDVPEQYIRQPCGLIQKLLRPTDETISSSPTSNTSRSQIQKLVVTRHPVSLFVSSLKEALFLRMNIFEDDNGNQNNNTTNNSFANTNRKPSASSVIPLQYQRFMQLIQAMSMEQKKNISLGITKDDLNRKTTMLETFLEDYDGDSIFNHHMNPIMSRLFRPPRISAAAYTKADDLEWELDEFDSILQSEFLTQEFQTLAQHVGSTKQPKSVVKRSSSSDNKKVLGEFSNTTIQKVCQLVRTDLCCLNYKLPEPCRRRRHHHHENNFNRVSCEWVELPTGERRIVAVIIGTGDGTESSAWIPHHGVSLRRVN